MTKEEILEKIEKLENHNFYLNMGHWDTTTGDIIRRNDREIEKLKRELETLEDNTEA